MASGVIAASDPRAAQAGADVLADGGNAVDAAIAAALVLFVVEPHTCGPGGDAFLLVSEPGGAVAALDGSGAVPVGLTSEALAADGFDHVPVRGARTVTVPGAVGLVDDALARYGSRSLGDVVGPALSYARDGFAVRRTLADTIGRAAGDLAADPVLGPLYVPDGRPRQIDEQVKNPKLAELLEQIAAEGAEGFYRGAVGQAIVDRVRAEGGYLSRDDVQAHRTLPVTPLSTDFRGATVWEFPLPTQGIAVLAALDRIPLGPIDWEQVLGAISEGLQLAGIDLDQQPGAPRPAAAEPRDTTYLAVIDGEGRGASLITSVFADFGSYLGIDVLGGPIHNRATSFYAMGLAPRPGKPFHTTIPSLVTRDGQLQHVLGLAGGYVQAQVQVQLILHLEVEGMTPQAAIDAPRMRLMFGGLRALEAGHPLADRFPEDVGRPTGLDAFGAAQIASRRGGHLGGGADLRRDGAVIVL